MRRMQRWRPLSGLILPSAPPWRTRRASVTMAKSARLWHKRCKGFARADRREVGRNPWEATVRFQRLDLNLLVALDALLTERSVSLAADRIYLSQSATSSALGRLREYFDDELLVLKGRQMVLTAR